MENLDSIDKQTLEYLKQDYEEIKKDQALPHYQLYLHILVFNLLIWYLKMF